MLNDEQLRQLLHGGESDRVEFTESVQNRDKIGQAICAFANDLPGHRCPGVFIVGVDDRGKPSNNFVVTDEMLRNLGGIRSDGKIQPFPSMKVEKRSVDGTDVAVILVDPSSSPPVRYDGRCWIRVGPRRGIATRDDEITLAEKRIGGDLPFDQRPARPQARIEDLDIGVFHEYLRAALPADVLAENERSDEHQLKAMGFMTPDGEVTHAGLLCFGVNPQKWLSGAYIQFAQFPGTDISSAAETDDHKKIDGTIFNQLRVVEELLKGLITTSAIIGDDRRIDTPNYPFAALQQVIRNAVLHRAYEGTNDSVRCYWFKDRVEIRSPGGPFGKVTQENFAEGDVTDYRNPKLAEAMGRMKLIERFGFGLNKTKQAMVENGNPAPKFNVDDSFVTVALPKSPGREFRLGSKSVVSLAQFLHLFGKPGYQLLSKHGITQRSTGGGIEAMLERAEPEQLRGLLDEIGRTKMALQRQMAHWEVERERRDLEDDDSALFKARLAGKPGHRQDGFYRAL